MVIRISDKTQNYSKVTKLLVKPILIIKFIYKYGKLGYYAGQISTKKLETFVSSYLFQKWWGRWDLNPHGISPNGF